MWHFAKKWTAVKFVNPWTSSHFSSELRDPTYVVSAMCPGCPRQNCRGKSGWLHPRESSPAVVHRPGGVTTFPRWLDPALVWSWDCCCSWGIWSPLRHAAPATFAIWNADMNVNKWMIEWTNEWMNELPFSRWSLFPPVNLILNLPHLNIKLAQGWTCVLRWDSLL